jgi:3-phenylpropionate/trans-cinnamate dioxygenase ferredoxin subunit
MNVQDASLLPQGQETQPPLNWVNAIGLEQLPVGRGRVIFAAGRVLAVWRVGGQVHVLEDQCPHAGASLAGGRLEGCVVRCPAHGLCFDVRTGRMALESTLSVRSYPVQVEEGRVWVGLGPD